MNSAPVTVKADDKSMTAGGSLPEFTYTVEGEISGAPALSSTPGLSCPANTNLPGTYTIEVDLLDVTYTPNYKAADPAYINGTLTVSANTDATLSSLVLSHGILNPVFSSDTYEYTAEVGHSTASLTVTPTAGFAYATIRVDGTVTASGSTSHEIPLAVGENTITIVVTAQDGTTTKTYTVTVIRPGYTVTFDSKGGSAVDPIENVEHGSRIDKPSIPAREGYIFAGWYKDGEFKEAWNFETDAVIEDITLYAKWNPRTDTAYTVEHYQQNIEDDGYTLEHREDLTGTTDETAAATPKVYTGFTLNEGKSTLIGAIAPDGSLVLTLYYDRNTFTVSFNSNGGSEVADITGVRYEATINAPAAPSRTGYRFAGWYKDEGLTEAWSFESDAVTEDITLYARWVKRISGSGPVIQVDQDGVQNAASVSSREEGGRKTITVVLETGRISEKLAQRRAGSVVTVLVSEQTDTADVQLDGKLAKVMEDTQAVLEIRTGIADYKLPMQQINMDSLIGGFGEDVEPSDVKVSVEISALAGEEATIVEDAATKGNYAIVVPPVDFTVRCTYRDEEVVISEFSGYIERTIAIPDGVDHQKITTAVIVEKDGTMRHAPTKIIVIDGKYYAQINSLTSSVYTIIWNPLEFEDVAHHWAKEAVNDMGSRLVVSGVGDGLFAPDRDVARAEFAAIIVRALGLKPESGKSQFTDVKESDWYSSYVNTASRNEMVFGYDDGRFGPNDKITREQAMAMIARAMGITGLEVELTDGETDEVLEEFSDAMSSSDYAKSSIARCVRAGLVAGKSDKLIAPRDNITRAETAVIVRRLLQQSDLI